MTGSSRGLSRTPLKPADQRIDRLHFIVRQIRLVALNAHGLGDRTRCQEPARDFSGFANRRGRSADIPGDIPPSSGGRGVRGGSSTNSCHATVDGERVTTRT